MNCTEKDFRTIIEEHKDMVFNISYRYTGNYDSAQDLSQEIFLRVWRYINNFRGDSSLKTWIYRIAYTTSINYAKKHSKLRAENEMIIGTMKSHDDPHRNIVNKNIMQDIEKSVASLPNRQKMVFILKQYEGKSYREIGEIMNITEKAVENLLYRARLTLQEQLKGYL